jgi:Na+:H+ antiporter, NhaC family
VTGDPSEQETPPPRAPSFADALAPVIVLVLLLALTIALFGLEATDGPLQVALLTSAAFAGLIALKNGYTAATLREAAIGGVSSAMGAIFILLAVGALIGTWNMAGTIPTVVSLTGVLGVSTMQYLPFAFFNMLNPLVALVYAFTGFRIEHIDAAETGRSGAEVAVDSARESPMVAPGGDGHVE